VLAGFSGLAGTQEFIGERDVSADIARAAAQGILVAADCGRGVTCPGEGIAQIVVGLGKVRLERHGAPQRRHRLRPALLAELGESQLDQTVERIGLHRKMSSQRFLGFHTVALLKPESAEQQESLRIVGRAGQQSRKRALGVLEPLLLQQRVHLLRQGGSIRAETLHLPQIGIGPVKGPRHGSRAARELGGRGRFSQALLHLSRQEQRRAGSEIVGQTRFERSGGLLVLASGQLNARQLEARRWMPGLDGDQHLQMSGGFVETASFEQRLCEPQAGSIRVVPHAGGAFEQRDGVVGRILQL